MVNFRSITMALWIEKGWRIPDDGLHQAMWDPFRDILRPCAICRAVFGPENRSQHLQYICHHQFTSFLIGFPHQTFSYSAVMPKVDIINCKTEGSIIAHLFAPSIASESTTGNIIVFEDMNIVQRGLKKEDPCFDDILIIW